MVALSPARLRCVSHSHSLVDFCSLLLLGKSLKVICEPLECVLPDAIFMLLSEITSDPSKILDAVLHTNSSRLHLCLLIVLAGCSTGLSRNPPLAADLRSFYSTIIHQLGQKDSLILKIIINKIWKGILFSMQQFSALLAKQFSRAS